jgi:cobalt-zinc-cadmium efflux system outer membrane protein
MLFFSFARRGLASAVAVLTALAMMSLGAAATAVCQTPLTLAAAVERGVAQAPLLAARQADTAAAHADAARAGQLPDPSLNFGVANYPVSAPGAFSLRSDMMTMRTIGVTQAIPSRAARDAERSLASAQIDATEAERTATAASVQQRVADAWIDLWASRQKRALLIELRGESALAATLTKARLRGGDGSAADALAARGESAALDNRLEAVDAELASAQAGLQRWLGPTLPTLAEAPDFGRLPVTAARLAQHVDSQAPMQAWQAREQVAQAALDQARAARHPDWAVSAMYGKRAPERSDMVTVQVSVSLPLFTRNRQDRGISARQAQADAVEFAHDDARRAQIESVARALASWQGWNRQIQRDRDTLIPLDRDRAATALAGYRGGSAFQPWLDARREEIEQRLSYADALAVRARLWASLAYLLPTPETTP